MSFGTIDLQSGTDTVNMAAGGNTLTVTNTENINGGSGSDALTYTSGVNFAGTTFSSIESILFDTGDGTSTMTVDHTTNFGSSPCLTLTGSTSESAGDIISSNGGMNLSGVMLSSIATVLIDANADGVESGESSPLTLFVDSTTTLGNATVTSGDGEGANHVHITSDNGLNLSGSSLFTTGGVHSILIDSGNDTSGAILTVNSSTQFTTGGVTEIRDLDSGGLADDIMQSTNGISFAAGNGAVQLLQLQTINFDSDNSGTDTLTFNASTSLGTTNFNGGTDNNDIIALNAGTYNIANNTITNVATLSGSTGNEVVTLGNIPSGLAIDLDAGTDTLNLGSVTNVVTVTNTEVLNGGTMGDTVTLGAATTSSTIDLGTGTDILNLAAGTNTLTVSNTETVNGTASVDTLTLSNAQSSGTVDLAGGTDTLNLAAGGNTLTASNAENVNGGTGADIVTLGAAQSSGTIDLAGGTDTVNLFNGTNAVTINNTETINGGTMGDTVTLGGSATGLTIDLMAGTDVLNLNGGTETLSASNRRPQ